VTVKEEEGEDEEEDDDDPDEPRHDQLGLALGPARLPASGPRTTLVSTPVPAPQDRAPPTVGAGASGVTIVVKEETEEEEETLGQLRDRLGLSARLSAPGARAAFVHIKVEDSTSGEDTDGVQKDTGWEAEGEGDGEEVEEDEEPDDEEGEEEGEEDEVEYRDLSGGGGKRNRAEDTAAPAPHPSLPPLPPQRVDVQWVEGQGERCSRTIRKPSGTIWWCSSAAVLGRTHCAHHAAQSKAGHERAQMKLAGSLLQAPADDAEGEIRAGGGGGGGRSFTSKFRGVFAQTGRGTRRWKAKFNNSGKSTHMGTFDREEDAARAWDRMMVWCHLHGVVLYQGSLRGVHTSDSIKSVLNFAYDEYAGELDEMQGILTQDAMVQKLRQEGRLQPGARKRKKT